MTPAQKQRNPALPSEAPDFVRMAHIEGARAVKRFAFSR
jgi:hypothetical protein